MTAAEGRTVVAFPKSELQAIVDQSPGPTVSLRFNTGEQDMPQSGSYDNRHHEFEFSYNHKFSFHINGPPMSQEAVDTCIGLRPPIVKILDPNVDTLSLIRAARPDALILYREFFGNQHLGGSTTEAYSIGQDRARDIMTREAVRDGLVNLVESYNEVLPESASADEHRRYNAFMMGFFDFIRASGSQVQPVAFNFATGNGNADMFLSYYRETLNAYDWLGFHEYDWPVMNRLHEVGLSKPDQPGDWFPGSEQRGDGGAWLALRYQRIMNPIVAELGDNWSIIITEMGMTQGVLGGDDVGPWASQNTVPTEPWNGATTPIQPVDYWATLQWYNNELMKDFRVAGACMFVTGAGGRAEWETFNHVPAITNFISDYQEILDSNPSPPDPPDPPDGGVVQTKIYLRQTPSEYVGIDSEFPAGTEFNLRAAADQGSGRQFARWEDHAGNVSEENPLKLNAGANLSLTAIFEDVDSGIGQPEWWPYLRPTVGLHGRNDTVWHGTDYDLVATANLESVSFMGRTNIDSMMQLRQRFPNLPFTVRIYNDGLQNEYFGQGRRPSPELYVDTVSPAITQQMHYSQVFRIHNEPNHLENYEGWGTSVELAQDFNGWFLSVIGLLRERFPNLKFLFPNLAQGGIHNDLAWFEACLQAVAASDGYGASCYWQNLQGNEQNHLSPEFGMRFFKYHSIANQHGITKPVFIAECGNSNHHAQGHPVAPEHQVAAELTEYYAVMWRDYSGLVYAVHPFLMSAPGWQGFVWREETGRYKQVVGAVGGMSRPPLE